EHDGVRHGVPAIPAGAAGVRVAVRRAGGKRLRPARQRGHPAAAGCRTDPAGRDGAGAADRGCVVRRADCRRADLPLGASIRRAAVAASAGGARAASGQARVDGAHAAPVGAGLHLPGALHARRPHGAAVRRRVAEDALPASVHLRRRCGPGGVAPAGVRRSLRRRSLAGDPGRRAAVAGRAAARAGAARGAGLDRCAMEARPQGGERKRL
ncbi:MAG: hypothetical protein AVDCRST_MAG51-1856, partial [uncultured Ramlibacter sp.]